MSKNQHREDSNGLRIDITGFGLDIIKNLKQLEDKLVISEKENEEILDKASKLSKEIIEIQKEKLEVLLKRDQLLNGTKQELSLLLASYKRLQKEVPSSESRQSTSSYQQKNDLSLYVDFDGTQRQHTTSLVSPEHLKDTTSNIHDKKVLACATTSFFESQTTPDLVPDVILHLVENYGFLRDVKNLLGFRLISKTWNIALQHIVQKRTVSIVSDENISAFLSFLQSEKSLEFQESNIRSVVFNVKYREAMEEFTQLPRFFLENLLSFRLNFEFLYARPFEQVWKFLQEAQLTSLEELQLVMSKEMSNDNYLSNYVPVFPLVPGIIESMGNISFPHVRRIEVPLHASVYLLKSCSERTLMHITLNVFKTSTELSLVQYTDFWKTFKTELIRQKESLTEFFLVNKAGKNILQQGKRICTSLLHANLRLKKLGLGITLGYSMEKEEEGVLVQLLNQQATTLEYLHLPTGLTDMLQLSYTLHLKLLDFPKLVELKFEGFSIKSGKLFGKFPRVETICLPTFMCSYMQEDIYESLTVRSVEVLGSTNSYIKLFQVFPNMKKLNLEGQIKFVGDLKYVLTKGTELKELSIKVRFKRFDELAWMRDKKGQLMRQKKYVRPIIADCFILGQEPQDCKLYQSGQAICNATTEFPLPSGPSLTNFHCLKYLSLEGYFTELTLWAGIKTLVTLKEFHLKSQSWLRLKTFLELECHLPKLKSWSYTVKGIWDVHKFFRTLPNVLGPNQIHVWVWKFNDENKVDKKVVNVEEFEDLPDDLRLLRRAEF